MKYIKVLTVFLVLIGIVFYIAFFFGEKRISYNGFSFKYPTNIAVKNTFSSDKNYSNFEFTAGTSMITVSLPVKNNSQYFSLASTIKNLADPTTIAPISIQGHAGQYIHYTIGATSSQVNTDRKDFFYIVLPTKYPLSPVVAIYEENNPNRSLQRTWHMIQSTLRYSGTYSFPVPANKNFQYMSQLSTPNHPVFISRTYHFEYAPTGNFGYEIQQNQGSQLLAIAVSSEDPKVFGANLALLVYKNDSRVSDDIQEFRFWRSKNLYDDPNDIIEKSTIGQNTFYKATQADGINSRSVYYYLIRPDYIYVFVRDLNHPDIGILENLNAFSLTPVQ